MIKFLFYSHPTKQILGSLHETSALIPVVTTAQFDTILNEPPVTVIQMRVNTCLPESVPRVIPHIETRITDTSFIQNNIKSGNPGMCSNIHPESVYAPTVYNRIHRQNPQRVILHTQYYKFNIGGFQTSLTSLGLTKVILNRNIKFIVFTCSHEARLR